MPKASGRTATYTPTPERLAVEFMHVADLAQARLRGWEYGLAAWVEFRV